MSDDPKPPNDVDWHNWLLKIALAKPASERTGVTGDLDDFIKLSGRGEDIGAEEAFNIFIRRWVHPQWWPHLLDDDDNDAEYVRRWIRGEYPR